MWTGDVKQFLLLLLLFIGFPGLSRGINWPGHEAYHSHLAPSLGMSGAILPLRYMSSCRAQGQP